MSLLIKGMKMPTECLSCDFCNPFVDEPYCRRLMRKVSKSTRLVDCPLTEVPTPHGRLKDADVLIKQIREEGINQAEFYANRNHPVVRAYGDCYGKVVDAPTIIEAEEGE